MKASKLLLPILLTIALTPVAYSHEQDSGKNEIANSDDTIVTKNQPHGTYIPPHGGQILVLRQPPIPGDVSIKVAPNMGQSNRFSMGTQNLPPTYAIPVHKHLTEDEILFVHVGRGTATLGDKTFPVETGATLYIPHGTWHTVVNETDVPAQLVWFTAEPGIEDFFRRIGVKPGEPWSPLSMEELTRISAEYGMIIKSD